MMGLNTYRIGLSNGVKYSLYKMGPQDWIIEY